MAVLVVFWAVHTGTANVHFRGQDHTARSSVDIFPATGFEGTTRYGSIKPGSTFFLSSDNVGNDGTKYCVEFGYFMHGENIKLNVIQFSLISGTPTTLWQQTSDSASGSLGRWQKAEFTFQGQTGTSFLIRGSTENSSNGILAVDQIKTYKGDCI
ncbi:uncharacterized protein LOC133188249 [Saccostrea echinata]|uniref:uncharacterized protein LOC133188249 n=1 Tax=Saccostrea echinata TaxID=191078 RepID=UPI002A8316BA|nr:uncharacterized protein LOC133188249 [Saccostrea echinata]